MEQQGPAAVRQREGTDVVHLPGTQMRTDGNRIACRVGHGGDDAVGEELEAGGTLLPYVARRASHGDPAWARDDGLWLDVDLITGRQYERPARQRGDDTRRFRPCDVSGLRAAGPGAQEDEESRQEAMGSKRHGHGSGGGNNGIALRRGPTRAPSVGCLPWGIIRG
jgi:hypothetical protein